MKPATSIVLFTTIAGAAQGLVVVLAVATIAGAQPPVATADMLWVATTMLVVALGASFFHLGHPLRAWRAALMWRTSWMSREVIVLPAFIAVTALSALLAQFDAHARWLSWISILLAALLWYCTAMIYACIRFIQEWAHPLTIVNYVMLGLSSGLVMTGALAVAEGQRSFADALAPWAIAIITLAWVARAVSLRRNARLKPRSTIQSATGITSGHVVQKSMGMTGGSFNTREFFHGASNRFFRSSKSSFQILAFLVPILLLMAATINGWTGCWIVAAPLQFLGLIVERWFFFAQARHPQNIYYQVVS